MKKIFALVAFVVLTACGGGSKTTGPNPSQPYGACQSTVQSYFDKNYQLDPNTPYAIPADSIIAWSTEYTIFPTDTAPTRNGAIGLLLYSYGYTTEFYFYYPSDPTCYHLVGFSG